MRVRSVDGPPHGQSPIGPIVLILPILAGILAALVFQDRRSSRRPVPAPAVLDPDELVGGWRGSRTLADGSRLDLELLPLHPTEKRQAFEARVLQERLGLGPGRPWRLDVTWVRPDRPVQGTTVTQELDIARWTIADSRGARFSVVAPAAEPSGAAGVSVSDPVRTLFASGPGLLHPGDLHTLFLWEATRPEDAEDPEGNGARVPEALHVLGSSVGPLAGPDEVLELEPFRTPRRTVTSILARAGGAASTGLESSGFERGASTSEGGARGL